MESSKRKVKQQRNFASVGYYSIQGLKGHGTFLYYSCTRVTYIGIKHTQRRPTCATGAARRQKVVLLIMPRNFSCLIVTLMIVGLCGCHSRPDLNGDFNARIQEFKSTAGDTAGAIDVGSPAGDTGDDLRFAAPPPSEVSTDWADLVTAVTGNENVVAERRWNEVVFFAYNQHVIGEAERSKIEGLADYLKRNKAFAAIVEGHCDSRGSDEFNRALGERRALAVRDYLLELGVGKGKLKTISYGDEKPVDPSSNEAAFARNRRAEFVIVPN